MSHVRLVDVAEAAVALQPAGGVKLSVKALAGSGKGAVLVMTPFESLNAWLTVAKTWFTVLGPEFRNLIVINPRWPAVKTWGEI